MWVNDVSANFALNGTTAQSALKQSFYAHNLVQPTITVSCQFPNQYEYNRLSEFVRNAQVKQINGIGDDEGLLYLRVFGGDKDTARPIVKGASAKISADGYVATVGGGAVRYVNSPTMQFQFVVAQAHNFVGIDDNLINQYQVNSILDIIQQQNFKEFIQHATVINPNAAKMLDNLNNG